MSSAVVLAYVIAGVVTTISLYAAANHFGDTRSARCLVTLSALAGALWPLLLVAIIQLGLVMVVTELARAHGHGSPEPWPTVQG